MKVQVLTSEEVARRARAIKVSWWLPIFGSIFCDLWLHFEVIPVTFLCFCLTPFCLGFRVICGTISCDFSMYFRSRKRSTYDRNEKSISMTLKAFCKVFRNSRRRNSKKKKVFSNICTVSFFACFFYDFDFPNVPKIVLISVQNQTENEVAERDGQKSGLMSKKGVRRSLRSRWR